MLVELRPSFGGALLFHRISCTAKFHPGPDFSEVNCQHMKLQSTHVDEKSHTPTDFPSHHP